MGGSLLIALSAGGVLEVAGVLDDDGLSLDGVGAGALLSGGLGDGHYSCGLRKGSGVCERESGDGSSGSSREGGETRSEAGEHIIEGGGGYGGVGR